MGTTKVVDVGELNEGRSSRNWHSSVRASLRFCSLIRKEKKHMVVLAGGRRGMSGDCRPYPYLRSTWPVCLDALGAQIQRWPLPNLLCAIVGVTLFSLGYLIHALDTYVEKEKSEKSSEPPAKPVRVSLEVYRASVNARLFRQTPFRQQHERNYLRCL